MRYAWLVLLVGACDGEGDGKDTSAPLVGPELSHTPPDSVVVGTATTFAVTATDPDDVASVTLFHRVEGESTWQPAPMVEGDDDVWSATLEATDIDDPGVEYYFEAEDAGDTPAGAYLPTEAASEPYILDVSVVGTAIPFIEDFEHEDTEGLSDLGWGNASLGFRGYDWATSTAQAYEGTRSVFHSRGHSDIATEMEDWLITPALDLSAVSSAQVTWREVGQATSAADHGLYVSIGSRDPEDGEYVAIEAALPAPSEEEWARSAVYDLSEYAGEPTVYIAWRFLGEYADDWYIDEVRVEELQPDLLIETSVSPSPIDPGGTGTLTVDLSNLGTVDGSGLAVSVAFPSGGASVAESSVSVDVPAGSSGTADFTLSIDAATPDNSYVPVEVTVTSGDTSWAASDELIVGDASTAWVEYTPSAEGTLEILLGVGDPDAPTWEETLYADTTADVVSVELDITDQFALLPPAAGDLRWYLKVTPEVAGSVDAFVINYGGEEYAATILPNLDAAEEAVVWLPEPPSFDVVATTTPSQLAPGYVGVGLGLYVTNEGSATQGSVLATLSTTDADVTVTDPGPYALTDDVWGAGDSVNWSGLFAFDVSDAHVDSSDIALELTLDDGVESWVVDLSLPVPYPYLSISDIDIDDDGGDGVLDADESAEVTLEITNVGDESTEGALTGTLFVESSSTATATVSTDGESFRELASGRSDTTDDPYTITVTGGAEGDTVDLLLSLVDDLRTYEVRTTLTLGEPPWRSLDATGDPAGDTVNGWDFDIVGGYWRVDDGVLQLKFVSDTVFDPDTLFIESWGTSTVAEWTYYRLVLQSGSAAMEGYDGGFTEISTVGVSYPSAYEVQLDITIADLGLSLDTISLGFASGWCGPDTYYCDHFPDGWGYPYVSWSPSLFFDLSW